MDNRELQLIVHLTRTLHFSRTSQECHVSPSSLSRIVQKAEQEVGAPLFERDNRTVRLTDAGLVFREYAVAVLERWEQLQQDLRAQTDSLSGTLSVFCSVTASYSFLHDLLSNFRLRYPGVEIHLHTGDSALALQHILEENEDIGIAARPDRLPEKLQFKEITQSPLVFIAPAMGCPLRDVLETGKAIRGAELPWEKLPFILSETGLARSRAEKWFRQRGIQPDIYAQVSGNEAIVSMVSLGFGLGVVPLLVVENSPIASKIEILKVEPALESFSIGICALKRRLSNPLVKAFWELSQEHSVAGE